MTGKSDSAFTGSVPEHYHRRMVPLIFDNYARDLARRIKVDANMAVLETACGTGAVTRELRRRLDPSVRIIATDLSKAMSEFARTVDDPPLENVSFRDADATSLLFADKKFAAVVCQFGVMFFNDRATAYKEAFRVLQPGGCFAFSTWDSFDVNPLPACAREAVADLLPADLPPFMAAPFSYYDLTQIKGELGEAGFAEMRFTVLPGIARCASAREAAEALIFGSPLGQQLDETQSRDQGVTLLTRTIAESFGEKDIQAPMQAIIVEAFKPGRSL